MECFTKIVHSIWLLTIFTKHSLQIYNVSLILKSWRYKIQANERLSEIKQKWSSIQFDVSYLSFIFFIPMSQITSVINRSGACYFLQLFFVGVCACDRTHQMEKTDLQIWFCLVFLSVPQRSVSCPLFFLIHINNLSN